MDWNPVVPSGGDSNPWRFPDLTASRSGSAPSIALRTGSLARPEQNQQQSWRKAGYQGNTVTTRPSGGQGRSTEAFEWRATASKERTLEFHPTQGIESE